ncbi:MAG: methyltransferase [Acidobacteriota bacterium]
MDAASRARLTPRSLPLFPGDSLFARVARTLCTASCVPRKELFESWEVARRIRRHVRGGRVVDLACGHSLVAHLLLLLDDTSPGALAVDRRIPLSAQRVADALAGTWPRLSGRVRLLAAPVESTELSSEDLVVSAHACGGLTDTILSRAVAAGARVAVLPCCHDLVRPRRLPLEGWLDGPLSLDVARAARLEACGYTVRAIRIPAEITPKNRLLLGIPPRP